MGLKSVEITDLELHYSKCSLQWSGLALTWSLTRNTVLGSSKHWAMIFCFVFTLTPITRVSCAHGNFKAKVLRNMNPDNSTLIYNSRQVFFPIEFPNPKLIILNIYYKHPSTSSRNSSHKSKILLNNLWMTAVFPRYSSRLGLSSRPGPMRALRPSRLCL